MTTALAFHAEFPPEKVFDTDFFGVDFRMDLHANFVLPCGTTVFQGGERCISKWFCHQRESSVLLLEPNVPMGFCAHDEGTDDVGPIRDDDDQGGCSTRESVLGIDSSSGCGSRRAGTFFRALPPSTVLFVCELTICTQDCPMNFQIVVLSRTALTCITVS